MASSVSVGIGVWLSTLLLDRDLDLIELVCDEAPSLWLFFAPESVLLGAALAILARLSSTKGPRFGVVLGVVSSGGASITASTLLIDRFLDLVRGEATLYEVPSSKLTLEYF